MDQSQSNASAKDEKRKSEEPETAESSSTSRPKSVWNDKLCKKFLCVVGLLGVDNCSPVKLLQLLNVPGLTRDQAAGKLKRYRKSLRKVKEDTSSGKKTVNYPVLPRAKLPGRWSSLEKNSQAALKIGSASTRPSFVTEETKDEPTAEVVKQPIWPSVNDQLPAIEEDRLREALWRTFPYRRPAAVEKVDPYPNYACMASNAASSNQYLRHVNGLLQQYSTNEALLRNISRSSTTTLMNRSSSCSSADFHVPSINSIETSLGKSTEAISLMGMSTSSWGMNVATLGCFNSSYASGYYFRNTMEAPVGSSTRINTNTTQSTFQAQGPNYQEVIKPYMMNNTVAMQAPGFTSTTQNFAAAYGNGREVTVPNYMNISMQAPVSIGLTSSTQTLTAYGGNGEVIRSMNTMGALGNTNPMQNTMNALGSIGFSKTTQNFPDYVNLDNPGVLQMPRTNPNLFGYDQVKEQADHSPEDAHSVTGDHSPPRVLLDDPDQPEAPLTSPGRRGSNPDLFEIVYNQGREYGRQDLGEEMDGFQYLLNSSENIISETVMSGVQLQIPDAHLSGSWVEP